MTTFDMMPFDWLPLSMRQIATLTSEIISQDMSAPQNPVRLVDERWFGQFDR
jgi:hypothetical protein